MSTDEKVVSLLLDFIVIGSKQELEKRDQDKKRRLERLEGAVGRIERVRSLLGEMKHTAEAEQPAGGRLSGETTGTLSTRSSQL